MLVLLSTLKSALDRQVQPGLLSTILEQSPEQLAHPWGPSLSQGIDRQLKITPADFGNPLLAASVWLGHT